MCLQPIVSVVLSIRAGCLVTILKPTYSATIVSNLIVFKRKESVYND